MSIERSWIEEETKKEEALKIEAPKIADEIEERAELIKQMDETNKRWSDAWDLYKKTVRKIH